MHPFLPNRHLQSDTSLNQSTGAQKEYEPVLRTHESVRNALRILVLAAIPAAAVSTLAVLPHPANNHAAPEDQSIAPVEELLSRQLAALHARANAAIDSVAHIDQRMFRLPVDGTPYTIIITADKSPAKPNTALAYGVGLVNEHWRPGEAMTNIGRLEFNSSLTSVTPLVDSFVHGTKIPTDEELQSMSAFAASLPLARVTTLKQAAQLQVNERELAAVILPPLLQAIQNGRQNRTSDGGGARTE